MAEERHQNALPNGYQFEGYRVEGVLGAGSFGVTYKARELAIDRLVAIKEYMPSGIAHRNPDDSSVRPISSADAEEFSWGLDRFQKEASTLVSFHHPNIVPVYRFFAANGTAYMVMEYQQGESLAEFLIAGGRLDEREIYDIIDPLLEGLERVHATGFLHRDIKPGNIYIRRDGSPVLLDFGAARQALGAKSRSITAVVSVGYAPMEQYSVRGRQSSATDIYALGATAYRAVTGTRPPDAVERIESDPYIPAATAGKGRYGESLLEAIDWALRMDAAARPQSIGEWRAVLTGEALTPTVVGAADAAPTRQGVGAAETTPGAEIGEQPDAAVTAAGAGRMDSPPPATPPPLPTGRRGSGGSKALPWIAGGLTVLIAISASGAGWLWYEAHEEANRQAMARAEIERRIAEEAGKRRRAEAARRQAQAARRRAAEEALKRTQELERRKREEAEASRREEERKRAEEERKRAEEAKRRTTAPKSYGLTVINKCNRASALYVAYRYRQHSGKWVTRGWLRVNRGGRAFRRLPTGNRIIYLYAHGDGLKWSAQGQPGAIRRWVRSRRFAHSTGRLRGTGARLVWFHKRTIPENTNGYEWSLICTN